MLDSELQAVTREAEHGRRYADSLVRVSESTNPFCWLTAAHLQAQATRGQPQRRADIKFRLLRGLYRCGLDRPKLLELFRLLDWVLDLPRELEYSVRQDLARIEKEDEMPYITSWERMAREEGREQGFEAGVRETCATVRATILDKYRQRWGTASSEVKERLEQIHEPARLLELLTGLLTVQSPEEWRP